MNSPERSGVPCRRVGTFTFGIVLVAAGLAMLASMFAPRLDMTWALKLSPLALVSLGAEVLLAALEDIMSRAFSCFDAASVEKAREVEPLEETIDRLIEEIRMRHIRRLQSGDCTMQLGFILNDLLTNFERVSDHCSNIALSVIEEKDSSVDRHAYLNDLKDEGSFTSSLNQAIQTYQLPQE